MILMAGVDDGNDCPAGHEDLARAAWELLPEGHAVVAVNSKDERKL